MKSGSVVGMPQARRSPEYVWRVLHHTWHLTGELGKISRNTELYLAKGGKEEHEGNKFHLFQVVVYQFIVNGYGESGRGNTWEGTKS